MIGVEGAEADKMPKSAPHGKLKGLPLSPLTLAQAHRHMRALREEHMAQFKGIRIEKDDAGLSRRLFRI